jgi:hypothetical protein
MIVDPYRQLDNEDVNKVGVGRRISNGLDNPLLFGQDGSRRYCTAETGEPIEAAISSCVALAPSNH